MISNVSIALLLCYINILKLLLYTHYALNNIFIEINSALYHKLIHWQQRFERNIQHITVLLSIESRLIQCICIKNSSLKAMELSLD